MVMEAVAVEGVVLSRVVVMAAMEGVLKHLNPKDGAGLAVEEPPSVAMDDGMNLKEAEWKSEKKIVLKNRFHVSMYQSLPPSGSLTSPKVVCNLPVESIAF